MSRGVDHDAGDDGVEHAPEAEGAAPTGGEAERAAARLLEEPAPHAGVGRRTIRDAPVAAKRDDIVALLEDEKAFDVVSIDLAGKSSIADHMVICSGRSARHVTAVAEKLMEALKQPGLARPRAEGVEKGDWALIDAADVVVHVFRPEVRAFYALEKMWSPAPTPAKASGER